MPTLALAATAETGAEGVSRNTDRAASRMASSLRAACRRRPLSGASVSRMEQAYHWNGTIRSAIVELFIPFRIRRFFRHQQGDLNAMSDNTWNVISDSLDLL